MRRFLCTLALATLLASPAGAGQDDARRAVRSGEARPLSEILSGLSGRYPGRVLDADIAERGSGEWTYGIRLLDPRGRVVELDVDARSGRVLRERGGADRRGQSGRDDGAPPMGFAPQGGFRDQGDDRWRREPAPGDRRLERDRNTYRRDRDDPARGRELAPGDRRLERDRNAYRRDRDDPARGRDRRRAIENDRRPDRDSDRGDARRYERQRDDGDRDRRRRNDDGGRERTRDRDGNRDRDGDRGRSRDRD
ncbi:hypothetical protein ABIE65_000534 [Constrictibacter sp. MBR-5]|jgi:hypothetical protein